jgi:transglutaminase-like putative cysteine protease
LTVQQPHERLIVEARARLDVVAPDPFDARAGAAWEDVLQALDRVSEPSALAAHEFRFDSPYVATSEDVHRYAAVSFAPGRPLLEAVMDLTGRIFSEFEYRGGVSDVSTPVRDVLAMRKGVCQDFAHLEIACLRGIGLPARYVSGYLLTRPPEGKPKLVGSDASHAWLSVWAGDLGWIDFDPTNNMVPGVEHITVAWGRDYGDVSPINGFIVGGGAHQVSVAVDVNRLAA